MTIKNCPKHVAIIPDGNRRWAEKLAETSTFGHHSGSNTLINIVEEAINWDIEYLTVYTFSTENWKRPQDEIDALMELLIHFLEKETPKMIEKGVSFETIGFLEKMPLKVQDAVATCKQATKNGKKIKLVLALNYGGRDEIIRAVKQLLTDKEKGKAPNEPVTEELISCYLDTRSYPDPDLLIRSGGEKRISNFLVWQLPYTEIYLTDTLWPDFTPQKFQEAIVDYQNRERRKGK